jgi:hypothetical protein
MPVRCLDVGGEDDHPLAGLQLELGVGGSDLARFGDRRDGELQAVAAEENRSGGLSSDADVAVGTMLTN